MDSQSYGPSDFPPKITVCVGAIVLQEERALLVRQTYGGLKGRWSIPWGFAYTPGPDGLPDPPHVAALRETKEEAGIVAEIDGLLGIQNHQDSTTGAQRLYVLFLCHHVSGEPAPDTDETDRAAYFSLEDLKTIEASVDEFCYWLTTRVLQGRCQTVPPESENPYAPHLAFL